MNVPSAVFHRIEKSSNSYVLESVNVHSVMSSDTSQNCEDIYPAGLILSFPAFGTVLV